MDNNFIFREMTKNEIEFWYENELSEAFIEDERKPLEQIFKLKEEGNYDILGLFEGDILLGYATIWKKSNIDLVLLDYLGVSKNLRNAGLGGKILDCLKSKYIKNAIVLESELPVKSSEDQIRLRRIGFYKRNGFAPVYEMATCGIKWQAMLWTNDDYDLNTIMQNHKILYGPTRPDVKIPLKDGDSLEKPNWMK